MSSGLSTTDELKATKPIFIGTFSGRVTAVVRHDLVFIDDKLYRISGNMDMAQILDAEAKEKFKYALQDYIAINRYVIENDRLIFDPDSMYLNHPGAFYFGE